MSLRILLLGSGGREHALSWRLAKSEQVEHIYVCPGNGGTFNQHKTSNLEDISQTDFPALVQFCLKNHVNLVVPGPEQPLVDGIETHFRNVGIPVFGPSARASRMEGSKAFAKDFMQRHHIPTAKYRTFETSQYEDAVNYVKTCEHRVVIKASGLAAGKGVLVPETTDEALKGLEAIMVDRVFGAAGKETVIEEYLEGPEISVLAFSDGYSIVPLPAAQDHKRIGEGDTGPNTGGMGAYAPAPVATQQIMDQIMKDVLRPTIDGMRHEGYPFIGMLFTGLMLTNDGPKVLEYNVRFGDPETEALVLLLDDTTDLSAILQACANHHLDSVNVRFRTGYAVSVVLASKGYPGSYEKGKEITFGDRPSNVEIFHAGTQHTSGKVYTSGGRVLAVSAQDETLEKALEAAYAAIQNIHFEGKIYRSDIAHRALTPEASTAPPASKIGGLTYAGAGVSVDAGNALVEAIKPYVRTTRRPGADAEIGGFGAVFDLKATGYSDPVLVSGTDGVGTKLRVAIEAGVHNFVGIDLVAMSVNDLLVQGAEPLYFLDYYACSKLDVGVASEVIKGIAEGCRQANCALIGGETAEMPGMYQEGDYDLAGFAVGAVERSLILPRSDIEEGDVLLGLSSSGVHSNGFSLVRKIVSHSKHNYDSPCPWDSKSPTTLGRELLTPTKIYVNQVLPAARSGLIKALAHITGGGFIENIPRVIPRGYGCDIDAAAWPYPGVFRWLKKEGSVDGIEMARTFNNGIGLVAIVSPAHVSEVMEILNRDGQAGAAKVYEIGKVTRGHGVQMKNLHAWDS